MKSPLPPLMPVLIADLLFMTVVLTGGCRSEKRDDLNTDSGSPYTGETCSEDLSAEGTIGVTFSIYDWYHEPFSTPEGATLTLRAGHYVGTEYPTATTGGHNVLSEHVPVDEQANISVPLGWTFLQADYYYEDPEGDPDDNLSFEGKADPVCAVSWEDFELSIAVNFEF